MPRQAIDRSGENQGHAKIHSAECVLGLLPSLTLHVFISVGQSGSFTLVNDANVTIDGEAVQCAAVPLINDYGARVVIYAVVSGRSADFT